KEPPFQTSASSACQRPRNRPPKRGKRGPTFYTPSTNPFRNVREGRRKKGGTCGNEPFKAVVERCVAAPDELRYNRTAEVRSSNLLSSTPLERPSRRREGRSRVYALPTPPKAVQHGCNTAALPRPRPDCPEDSPDYRGAASIFPRPAALITPCRAPTLGAAGRLTRPLPII